MARTHGQSSTTLGTSRLTRPSVTRLWRLIASKASGRIKSPHYPARRPKADICGATRDVRYGPKADNTAVCSYRVEITGEVFYSANPNRPVFTCGDLSNCKTILGPPYRNTSSRI